MADSCRPVSRHGRYNAAGPSSVQYNNDVASYGNVDYTPSDEMITVNQPAERSDRPARPRTSRGRRARADIPPRPGSRRSRPPQAPVDRDQESYGRPASRVGYSPESEYRYSHDEFSRQLSPDNIEPGRQTVNSPSQSPDMFSNGTKDEYNGTLPQRSMYNQSPQSQPVDRLIVSPSNPHQAPQQSYRQSPQGYRRSPQNQGQSPQGYRKSPHGYRQSPQNQGPSPQGYRQNQQGFGQSPQNESPYVRPSSRDYINVSPIQRDEPQVQNTDLHHEYTGGHSDPYPHEGETYQQHFSDGPQYRNSPYRDSPQTRDSPYKMDSPYNNRSPTYGQSYGGSPENQHRPPPTPRQRPKSARPKTGRKKSARVRQRYEEQETSQPQQCDTSSILNTGDPYGRPSSSLSRYKPLPAIATPRGGDMSHRGSNLPTPQTHSGFADPLQPKVDILSADTQTLTLGDDTQFRPADDDMDMFTVEDIQAASDSHTQHYNSQGIPSVDALTDFPHHLSDQIYKHSVENYESNLEGATPGGIDVGYGSAGRDYSGEADSLYGGDRRDNMYGIDDRDNNDNTNAEIQGNQSSPDNKSGSKPLDFLHELPQEPSESEKRLLLAIKLPDGKRLQRYFRPDDTLSSVLHFAENETLLSFCDFHLMCNAPRMVFEDLSLRIEDTNIKDRTVMYLEEND